MLRSQPRRQAQEPLHALELVEPILGHARKWGVARSDHSGGAATRLIHRHLPVFAQRPLAEAGCLEAILAEEDDHRHAIAAIDLQLALRIRMDVAVDVARLDDWGGFNEALKDRTLTRAVAAPDPRQDEHLHLARERGEEQLLLAGELHHVEGAPPTIHLRRRAMFGQKLPIGEAGLELGEEVHCFLASFFSSFLASFFGSSFLTSFFGSSFLGSSFFASFFGSSFLGSFFGSSFFGSAFSTRRMMFA